MGGFLRSNPPRPARAALPLLIAVAVLVGCDRGSEPAPKAKRTPAATKPDRDALRRQASNIFGKLPTEAPNPGDPISQEKITLGRTLYFDARLSADGQTSCNGCHPLDRYGVNGESTSTGHGGERPRNAPTVYNAALHVAQFWDGRAEDVEAGARLSAAADPEAAATAQEAVLATLRAIPGYQPLFRAAFPEDEEPVSLENAQRAIGAFERRLITPSAFDAFLAGDDSTVTDAQLEGLATFMRVGCTTCHVGPAVGGSLYRKLGAVKPYGTEDPGRFAVTGNEADRGVFKVPSLRNVAQTAPYLHDGSIAQLEDVIRIMGEHQLGLELSKQEIAGIRSFLRTLTGHVDPLFVTKPKLPERAPEAPAPD